MHNWQRIAGAVALALVAAGGLGPAETWAVPAPSVWKAEDYPASPPRWFGVEVARFPSRTLATGIEQTLRDRGWGPVVLLERDGVTIVVVGETDHPGRAWYLREELAHLRLAEGKLIELQAASPTATPRGLDGPFLPPFVPSPETAPGKLPTEDEIRARLRTIAEDLSGTPDSQATIVMLDLWGKNEFTSAQFADGVLAACRILWKQKADPEMLLWLAGRLAREGEWPAAPEQRLAAGDFVADLLYGYRRDWRGAFAATRTLAASPLRTPAQKASDELRLAALAVELVDRRAAGPELFPAVRFQLSRALEMLPPENQAIEGRIALVYLQTFAWEGNWARVEELARDFATRWPERSASNSMARIFLARSLERRRAFEEASKELDEVIGERLTEEEWLRFGMESVDPGEIARDEKRRFDALAAGADPMRYAPTPTPYPGERRDTRPSPDTGNDSAERERPDSREEADESDDKPWWRFW